MQIAGVRRDATRRRRDIARACLGAMITGLLLSAFVHAAAAQDAASAVLDAPAMLGGQGLAAAKGLPGHGSTSPAGDKTRTRFVIGLEHTVDFQVFTLTNPNRVIVELPTDVKVQLPPVAENTHIGLVKSFHGGQSAPGKMRFVIDVAGPVVVEKAFIEKSKDTSRPQRLVLSIISADQVRAGGKLAVVGISAAGSMLTAMQPPVPRPAKRPSAQSNNVFKPIIVIDPGHGGFDSGATKHGTVEKDVVLAFSLRLRDKLQQTGRYKVFMTRDSDVFVDLDERRAFADRSKAALFIAVHADYAGADARGATIYSLRDNVANELERSAKTHIGAEVLSPVELTKIKGPEGDPEGVHGILTDLAVRELNVTKGRTRDFAGTVIETMGGSTNMMSNPDREAGFRVLKSAKMPSVLIELAYVTNRADAANLNSDAWRDRVSGSIARAVENYFSHPGSRLPM